MQPRNHKSPISNHLEFLVPSGRTLPTDVRLIDATGAQQPCPGQMPCEVCEPGRVRGGQNLQTGTPRSAHAARRRGAELADRRVGLALHATARELRAEE